MDQSSARLRAPQPQGRAPQPQWQTPQPQQWQTPQPQWRAPQPTPARPQRAPEPSRLPKALALARVRSLKRGITLTSVLAFGTLAGLAVTHNTGATSQAASSSTSSTSSSSSSASSGSQQTTGGNFFQQPQGGTGIGSQSSGQAPVSGSSTS